MIAGFACVCPLCHAELVDLTCGNCSRHYDVVDGIPIIIAGETDMTGQQAAFFDEAVESEFEIERPAGAPALYDWLLGEKFRLGIAGVSVRGRTALVVCGGSGMDAEFLARAGAEVVSSDISLGGARRTLERSRRHGISLAPLVANAERLPFADRSIDIVYVHDGLHHLERPLAGLAEMARVARVAVCVTEPARAAATAVAATIGIAENVEEAGNRVARLTLAEVQETLERHGFRIARARRYAMFYRHEPGPVMRALSRPLLFPLARAAFRVANVPLARIGNKLAVTAVRT
jgi:ubiquinone/menaquinone biosynthesis C-methylase UbiE